MLNSIIIIVFFSLFSRYDVFSCILRQYGIVLLVLLFNVRVRLLARSEIIPEARFESAVKAITVVVQQFFMPSDLAGCIEQQFELATHISQTHSTVCPLPRVVDELDIGAVFYAPHVELKSLDFCQKHGHVPALDENHLLFRDNIPAVLADKHVAVDVLRTEYSHPRPAGVVVA